MPAAPPPASVPGWLPQVLRENPGESPRLAVNLTGMAARPFEPTAHIYDLLYEAAGKDYRAESAALHDLIRSRSPGARSLLDVACGTGAHLSHLRQHYDVAGLDAEPAMLRVARQRLGDVPLTEGDMRTFDLGRTFDVITCLFSAIGYMRTAAELEEATETFARHLAPGGVVIVDGWVRRDAWRDPGTVHAISATRDGRAAARVARSSRDGIPTKLELHHLVASTEGIDHIVEIHHLTLFSDDDYRRAFTSAGLEVAAVPSPHPDRDRYVATAPS